MNKQERLNKLRIICESCCNCVLRQTRNKLVFGEGSVDPKIMCIGEAPGRTENKIGRPFIGRSGQLLRKMLVAINLSLENDVFISNIIRCWPPDNRVPEPEEIEQCVKFLKKQIEIIQPKLLLFLGKTAVKGLLPELKNRQISDLRKVSKTWSFRYMGIPVLITYHPSALLMDPSKRILAKEDFIFLQNNMQAF